jgi:chemotaxis protein MotB
MAAQGNAAPVLIKRKKVVAGGGHHGGAWKVAYADFVTAMMAFFMLMWLLNATTEKQRKGLADYFSPTIPVNRISGGGDGSFGGTSVMSEETMAQDATGATSLRPTENRQARGVQQATAGEEGQAEGAEADAAAALRDQIEAQLLARSGESMTMESLMRHVVTRVSDEGLVIELFDLPDAPLFTVDHAEPAPALRALAPVLVEVLVLASNPVAVNGHVRAYPAPLAVNPVWNLSAARAQAMRDLLQSEGLDPARMQRITGYADRKPVTADPAAIRNNRIEVVLLRRNR